MANRDRRKAKLKGNVKGWLPRDKRFWMTVRSVMMSSGRAFFRSVNCSGSDKMLMIYTKIV